MNLEEIKEKLKRIPLEVYFKPEYRQKRKTIKEYMDKINKNTKVWNKCFATTLKNIPLTDQERSMFLLVNILFITEAFLSGMINISIYALMLDEHHDVWSEIERNYVSSFQKLVRRVSLSVKLKFLEAHNFSFFSEMCPKDIRNAVAHQNFEMDNNGTVAINKHEYSVQDLRRIITEVNNFCVLFIRQFMNASKTIQKKSLIGNDLRPF